MKVCVFGASGYGGQVLMRLLLDHPKVDKVLAVSSSTAGSAIDERDGGLGPDIEKKLPEGRVFLTRDQALAEKPDAVFSALPHGASAQFCEPFFDISVIFDLSADFRLRDPKTHKEAYGNDAPFPDRRNEAVYGLSEVYRERLKTANIVAVPGCYPTCTLLPLLPLAKAGILGTPITVNALSGISGAGRSAKESSLFVERAESVMAYNPARKHRHLPEMTQELRLSGSSADLFFTPHLVPMRRGMIATTSFPVDSISGSQPETREDARTLENYIGTLLYESYSQDPFIRLTGQSIPSSRDVVGSNRCDIGWMVADARGEGQETRMVYLFSALDNLVKGAAGQAVQDFNLRFGFPETTGLPLRGDV